jgi:hypothetical protein
MFDDCSLVEVKLGRVFYPSLSILKSNLYMPFRLVVKGGIPTHFRTINKQATILEIIQSAILSMSSSTKFGRYEVVSAMILLIEDRQLRSLCQCVLLCIVRCESFILLILSRLHDMCYPEMYSTLDELWVHLSMVTIHERLILFFEVAFARIVLYTPLYYFPSDDHLQYYVAILCSDPTGWDVDAVCCLTPGFRS